MYMGSRVHLRSRVWAYLQFVVCSRVWGQIWGRVRGQVRVQVWVWAWVQVQVYLHSQIRVSLLHSMGPDPDVECPSRPPHVGMNLLVKSIHPQMKQSNLDSNGTLGIEGY